MIERFNFYDVYGYFIPGAVLIFVLWLPHAVVQGFVPSEDFEAALGMVVAAYVAGHVLQIIATQALPSSEMSKGKLRAPSDLLLEPGHPNVFPEAFRVELLHAIWKQLHLDASDLKIGRRRFSSAAMS